MICNSHKRHMVRLFVVPTANVDAFQTKLMGLGMGFILIVHDYPFYSCLRENKIT